MKTLNTFSFGKMPISNHFLSQDEFSSEYFFDMSVIFDPETKLFRLKEQPAPEMMFHENYTFFSSTSKKMSEHFEQMAYHYMKEFIPNKEDAFVVELGSNDGIMLRHFEKENIKHLGIEPSSNVAEVAHQNGVNTISKFFNSQTAKSVQEEYGQADIICASNVMCHIPDLDEVGRGVDLLLKDKGVFIFEDPYLGDMIQKTSYDQIYDEHIYIFSVQSVSNAFAKHGLEVFHVEPQSTHGGSMRYYLCRKNAQQIRNSVIVQLKKEDEIGLGQIETYQKFINNCQKSKEELVALLRKLKAEKKRVVGYAATSKSTTILNFCQIGPDLIEYISDTTPLKQGKYSPGMHIPIKTYEEFKNDTPDYVVLFAWNHAQEIFDKEKEFLNKGGKWILFVPEVHILESSGAKKDVA